MSVAKLLRPPVQFAVSVYVEGARTVLALRGEADVATLPDLVAAMARVLADDSGDVVIDLAETTFIDTATLRAVLDAREALDGGGRQLTIRSPSLIAARLLAVFGLSHLVSPSGTAGK